MNDERDDSERHNGWANDETWAVGLWLDNEQGSCHYWAEQATCLKGQEDDRIRLAQQLEEEVTDGAPGLGCTLYADLLGAALDKVDWYERRLYRQCARRRRGLRVD